MLLLRAALPSTFFGCCASWTFAAPQTVPRSVQQGSATGLTASPVRSWALGTLPRDESVVSTNAVAAGANFFSKAGGAAPSCAQPLRSSRRGVRGARCCADF
eukprot:Skav231903  [mRNA]  locus=scaffold960:223156:224264:- [translate_table: standard]